MENRRTFLGRGVALGAAGLLTGCGDGSGSAARTDPATTATSTTPSVAPPVRKADARIPYGRHRNQWGDLYLPASGRNHPVVVTLHGGGWQAGLGAEECEPFAAALTAAGIAVWNVEYRLVHDGGGWPATLADPATAIDLLPTVNKSKAGGRLDLSRVVTFGASAGGHLAAWAVGRARIRAREQAVLGGPPRQKLRGALAYAAILDLGLDSDNTGASLALMNGSKSRYPERFTAGSPIALLPAGVPVVCMHGDADSVIPIEHARRYVAKAKQVGDPAKLVELPGVDHPNLTPIRVGEPLWDQVRTELDVLLKA